MRLGRRIGIASFVAAIGVLAHCDLAFGCTTRDRAYLTAMKSDLRVLVDAETKVRASTGRFSNDLRQLRFRSSGFVTAPVFDAIDANGWSATVRHEVLPTACYIFMGARPGHAPPNQLEGEPWCDDYVTTDERHAAIGGFVLLGLLAMTIAAAFAFRPAPGSRNWPAMGVALASLVGLLQMTATSCGLRVNAWTLIPLAAAATIFTYALHRRIRRA